MDPKLWILAYSHFIRPEYGVRATKNGVWVLQDKKDRSVRERGMKLGSMCRTPGANIKMNGGRVRAHASGLARTRQGRTISPNELRSHKSHNVYDKCFSSRTLDKSVSRAPEI